MGTTESILYDDEDDGQNEKEIADLSTPASRRKGRPSTSSLPSTARRRNVRSPSEKNSPLFVMNATILGLPKAGKQTLLHRLRGKDPFSAVLEKQSSAQVPYQSPRSVEDRIQLHAQIHRVSSNTRLQTDLAILLIDPRHDRERIEQSIGEAVQLTWRSTQNENNKPFCLCILLNFWDKLYKNDKKLRKTQVSESDVQQMTLLALQQLSTDVEPSRLHLQCTTSSLFNCYGLGILHFFIYQSYLLRKQWQLQKKLQAIQQSFQKSRESVPQVIPYELYIKQLRNPPPAPSPEQPTQPTSDSSQAPTLIKAQRRPVVMPEVNMKPTSSVQNTEASRKALEAFLADEDDEDEVILKHNVYDSDEDSEVFFDESGRRHMAGAGHSRSDSQSEISSESNAGRSVDNKTKNNETGPVESRERSASTSIDRNGDSSNDSASRSSLVNAEIVEAETTSPHASNDDLSEEDSNHEPSNNISPPAEAETSDEHRNEEPTITDEELTKHTSNGDRHKNENLEGQETHPVTANKADENPTPTIISTNNKEVENEEDGDEREFFVEEADDAAKSANDSIPEASSKAIENSPRLSAGSAPFDTQGASNATKAPLTNGTSQDRSSQMNPAVLAAIAAAQQEAQAMLEQQLSQESEKKTREKKPKKEKKKKEKKEKKKKEVKYEREVEALSDS
ncbi:hypothetical protein FisN_13Hh129 [Fistulifera solaris]|jgi:hypothetical protein|uniref:Uncharacterized protein n=1 Tax=Fistulifera solaris TaxID=1519565 RepID=A0A1Z5KPA7_FISSO|nr:hypothetical protein FisN_13Hh129 [Fistulifera solaris]|eukprot:GAX27768.1 hypothetical protein FisN_13Hh129 [Fistulifera solaris]